MSIPSVKNTKKLLSHGQLVSSAEFINISGNKHYIGSLLLSQESFYHSILLLNLPVCEKMRKMDKIL